MHEVAAVELRADLNGQLAVSQRFCGVGQVGCGQRELVAQRHKDLDLAAPHRLDRLDGAKPMLARRLEPARATEAPEPGLARAVVDPEGAVSLDIAVPADRTLGRRLRGRYCRGGRER